MMVQTTWYEYHNFWPCFDLKSTATPRNWSTVGPNLFSDLLTSAILASSVRNYFLLLHRIKRLRYHHF